MNPWTEALFGIKVKAHPLVEPVPVLQVRADCPCSDEIRQQMNAYLLEMFGMKEVAYMVQSNVLGLNTSAMLFMRPEIAGALRDAFIGEAT